MIAINKNVFYVIFLLICFSCAKSTGGETKVDQSVGSKETKIATVTTNSVTSITTVSAISGGKIVENGGATITERGVVISTKQAPTIHDIKVGTTTISGSGEFDCNIAGLTAATLYYVRAYAINSAGVAYGNEASFTTATIANATFKVDPLFIVGSSIAALDADILTDGGDPITERGICWGLTENPTVENNKVKASGSGVGKYRTTFSGLSPKTTYHVRAYAINSKGVSYSNNLQFTTIGKGNLTYTFNKSANPTSTELAAYNRLQVAIDSAVWYVNNYTSAVKHVWINYEPSVATADANNEGWMRFGTGEGFQNLRTMLHELNHTFGTGTTNWWWSNIVNGKLQATHTNNLLNKIQGGSGVQLSGDSQHWWPYGLNQNSEVTSSWDYVYNCILIEQMRKDGLAAAGNWSQ